MDTVQILPNYYRAVSCEFDQLAQGAGQRLKLLNDQPDQI
jgi:hypothetical protein